MDSRYVGDNHKPKSSQNGLVTKRENESEGDPLEGGPSVGFVASSVHVHICIYMCVCVCCEKEKERKERKKRKKKKKKKEKKKRKEK